QENHTLTINPEHVFIAYRPGYSSTPLGNPRLPPTYVHTPDPRPISLSEALISNYRVDHPAGYIDHGGSTVVFFDPTGQGD
ncbi:hypothetical protein, partial [Pseudomonas urmiensis]